MEWWDQAPHGGVQVIKLAPSVGHLAHHRGQGCTLVRGKLWELPGGGGLATPSQSPTGNPKFREIKCGISPSRVPPPQSPTLQNPPLSTPARPGSCHLWLCPQWVTSGAHHGCNSCCYRATAWGSRAGAHLPNKIEQ